MNNRFIRIALATLALAALLPLGVVFCSALVTGKTISASLFVASFAEWAAPMLAAAAGGSLLWLFRKPVADVASGQVRFLDELSRRWVPLAIFASAAVSLFLELVMIRWQGCVFETFAFYKNYSLLACFLGLGLGYALAHRESIHLALTIPLLAFQMLFMTLLRHGFKLENQVSILATPVVEQLNMGYGTAWQIPSFLAVNAFMLVILLLSALAFLPVGQLCGRLMRREDNLKGYGWNLLGSLAGTAAIFLVSFLWTPPVIWFGVAFLCLLPFLNVGPRSLLFSVAAAFAAIAVLAWPVNVGSEQIYSPYQLLERGYSSDRPERDNRGLMVIRAAGHYYQRVHDLAFSNANRTTDPHLAQVAAYYELPYQVAPAGFRTVAVVGSGTGNDVAAALRMGAEEVQAVEIDPAIRQLGWLYHPEKPYQDPRVKTVIDDARSFFRTTPDRFDLVVYGLLDSHTLLSHASSVRLDSFVYTVEGFREAASILNENGVLSLAFSILSDEIGRKIYLMMEAAFPDSAPLCVRARYDGSVIFFHGQNLRLDREALARNGFEDVSAKYASDRIEASVSTDDWPFFYVPKRVYPWSYVIVLGLLLAAAALVTANFAGQDLRFGNLAFFFLGAGFMLVETKGITEMGLTFGNTWQVVGIVIVGVLTMAYLANLYVGRVGVRRPTIPFLLLLGSIALGWAVSRAGGLPTTPLGKLGTVAVLTVPMLFSGLVFSSLLKKAENVAGVMAINMLGSMLGGVLEYNSMFFGFRFLYLLAAAIYLAAMACAVLARRRA